MHGLGNSQSERKFGRADLHFHPDFLISNPNNCTRTSSILSFGEDDGRVDREAIVYGWRATLDKARIRCSLTARCINDETHHHIIGNKKFGNLRCTPQGQLHGDVGLFLTVKLFGGTS